MQNIRVSGILSVQRSVLDARFGCPESRVQAFSLWVFVFGGRGVKLMQLRIQGEGTCDSFLGYGAMAIPERKHRFLEVSLSFSGSDFRLR